MNKNSGLMAMALCVAAVVLMLIALLTTSIMAGSITPVGKTSQQIMRVAEQLDSVSSMRTILFSYTRQYATTEATLNRALNTALGFLTLGMLLVTVLAIAVVRQMRQLQALRQQLQQLQEEGR